MEIKVWVEGLQKTICGVTATTTCQDIVYALAYATGKRGRFVLLERWGKTEKTLAPSDCLMPLLQQKGNFHHDVHFILRSMDGPSTAISKASSPLTLPGNGNESSFQRASTTGNSGTFRKSLTPHGLDFVPPRLVSTKLSPSSTSEPKNLEPKRLSSLSGLKENNLPVDLMTAGKIVANLSSDGYVKETKPARKTVSKPVLQAPPSVSGSLDISESKDKDRNSPVKKKKTREEFITSIRQYDEQGKMLAADAAYFDKEIAIWEERALAAGRDVETLENQISQYQNAENNVIQEIKDLSKLGMEDRLRDVVQSQKVIDLKLETVRTRLRSCEQDILHTKTQSQHVYDEVQKSRELQQSLWEQRKSLLDEERERLVEEIRQMTVMQEREQRKLDEMCLDENRLDSTLLAKTLELESLQESLKRANMEGFVGQFVEKSVFSSTVSPDEPSKKIPLEDFSQSLNFDL